MRVWGWQVALAFTIALGLLYGWGGAVIGYLIGWWLAYIFFGGLREWIAYGHVKRLRGFGEEPSPREEYRDDRSS